MRIDAGLDETERLLEAQDTTRWQHLAQLIADECHPEQRDFVLDPARYLAALVGRGGGKTSGGRARFVRRLLLTPGAKCIYIAKTRDHAERLMWIPLKEVFKALGFVTGRDVVYNETKLRCTLPKTGASLQLWGADKPGYVEALRGDSYHEVGIDEAAIHPDRMLSNLIRAILGPRLLGALWLIGTPGNHLKGMFYDVTRRGAKLSRLYRERDAHPGWKGWSLHKWSLKSAIDGTRERPIATLVQLYAIQQDEIATQGLSDDNPIKRREYDGEWAADDTITVYRYRAHVDGSAWNQWDPPREGPLQVAVLPETFDDWAHVIAIDLGFSDPTAINVFAFSPSDPSRTIYHRWCFEQKGMGIQDLAHKLLGSDMNHERPGGIIGAIGGWPSGMVADSAHQMAAAILHDLANVYGLRIEPATKGFRYKIGAIEVVNGDLVDGRLRILKGSELEAQMVDLQWTESPRTGEPMERKDQPNHCFAAGTMVASEFGDVPIENIRTGDRVWTRSGLRRVTFSGRTGTRATLRASLSNGRSLTGTAEHKIWTANGWRPLASLTVDDTLVGWENTVQPRWSYSLAGSSDVTRMGLTTQCASTSPHQTANSCTASCGLNYAGQSRPGITSTTKTATIATIGSRIWNPLKLLSTIACMPLIQSALELLAEQCLSTRSPPLVHGTARPQAVHGTPSTRETSWKDALLLSAHARCAAPPSSPRCAPPKCAVNAATPVRDEQPEPTMKPERAQGVVPNSASTDTPSRDAARLHVVAITPGLEQSVYDLSVDGDPEFFANGVLVHNSTDCAIYGRSLISHLISAGFVAPDERDPSKDPRSPQYVPPMPDEVGVDDYSALMGDDYQSMLG